MGNVIEPIIIGVLVTMLGFSNMKGNISSVHRYHRKRISEENILPFGKTIGLGTVICGASLIASGCLTFAAEKTRLVIFATAGEVVLVGGVVIGLAISLYAIIKYNKGLF